MNSFRFVLIRNFLGTVFITLLIVFFLFNAITNNFISAEAQRELERSIAQIESIAPRTAADALLIPTQVQPFIERVMATMQNRQIRQLMMNSDGIVINQYNEVFIYNPHEMNEEAVREIYLLAGFFLNNRALFENEAMVSFNGGTHTYYLLSIEYPIIGGLSFSVLLYTDITSALQFVRNVNGTLAILLCISALTTLLMAVFISSKVQKSILRLSKYAEVIGQGTFNEKVEVFDYKEFNKLAQNMNVMSDKLFISENNQKQFFQNVSHELRTPLMSIQGYAEGIREEVLNKNDAADIILMESERMAALVNQLLYISRMDGGLNKLNIKDIDLNHVLYNCVDRLKILAEKSSKKIVVDIPLDEQPIKADEEKIQRAVDNLIINCIRYAKTTIMIRCFFVENNIKIFIEDDGTGFNEVDLPHLFERFYKGENGHSGLGLAICKDIINAHGGTVTAENIYKEAADFLDTLENKPTGARFIISM